MTARTPLYWDGTNLKEMSSSEITEWVTQTIFQYANNPSVVLTVTAGSGNITPTMNDTRFRSSAAAQQASSFPTSGALDTVTTAFDHITQTDSSVSVTGDTNNVLFPEYYESSAGAIQSMSQTDFIDTFIKPALVRIGASSEGTAGDYGGTYTINTGTSLANHTLVSSTAVFTDTRADTSSFSSGQIVSSGTFKDHSTTVNSYYLHKRDAVDNTPSRTPLFIDNATNNLNQYSESDIEGYLAEYVRALAVNDDVASDHNIDYNINGSGNQRGSSMVDTKLDGSGTETQRFVGGNDYRSQKFPNGSAATVSTFVFNLLLS